MDPQTFQAARRSDRRAKNRVRVPMNETLEWPKSFRHKKSWPTLQRLPAEKHSTSNVLATVHFQTVTGVKCDAARNPSPRPRCFPRPFLRKAEQADGIRRSAAVKEALADLQLSRAATPHTITGPKLPYGAPPGPVMYPSLANFKIRNSSVRRPR